MKRLARLVLFLSILLIPMTAQAAKAPRKLNVIPDDKRMTVGQTLKLTALPVPAGSATGVLWNSTNRAIATVDAQGLVTAHAAGTVKIRARSKANKNIATVRTFTIAANPATTDLAINQPAQSLPEGGQVLLTARTNPAKAGLTILWRSSDESVAEVDLKGRVWAVSPGTAEITAYIEGGRSDSIRVQVRGSVLVKRAPARITPLKDLEMNQKAIDEVRASALGVVNRLLRTGKISPSDAQRRITILDRAFAMYNFPWMTNKVQKYWTRAYGTKKDFVPGVVYYGLPYIQHGLKDNSINRTYDVDKAVRQKFFTDAGKGYYRMDTEKKRDGMYVGNDCSSFVGMSIWGANSSNALIRTSSLYSTKLYRTLNDYSQLRPGDILVRSNWHVVFFLYFIDEQQTQMMILEQGGGNDEDLHNTVCATVVPTARYLKNRYRARRLASLG